MLLLLKNLVAWDVDVDNVRGIDLTVSEREIVTIAAGNGAGKSTLVKGIMGLLPRVSGDLSFDGQDLLSSPLENGPDWV
ncbi:ABC-type branched-subunit amino acid transport system ATPase component [Rhizobium wenxiniae]|uniref:ABC-type branched-subunit amino acid transport system ATPase component n=1 Tax=Rhizobium wenxiniae TaxID=1737357 RepID=A0A7W9YB23_9HYPH|nr:ATP-binding cassette domain-containing protein [Rhizobium wenxiniae]MBB6165316.1 ABC-type branched-subunit amino acid transport system ATPase component [Rhizobium wenxiniae]